MVLQNSASCVYILDNFLACLFYCCCDQCAVYIPTLICHSCSEHKEIILTIINVLFAVILVNNVLQIVSASRSHKLFDFFFVTARKTPKDDQYCSELSFIK